MNELSSILNNTLNVDYPVRYWRVLVGWWLKLFIEILFDRYSNVVGAADKFGALETWITPGQQYVGSAARDLEGFIASIVGDRYNLFLFSRIIEILKKVPFQYRSYPDEATKNAPVSGLSAVKWTRHKVNNIMFRSLKHLVGDRDVFFYRSHINRLALLLMNLKLNQVPTPGGYYVPREDLSPDLDLRGRVGISAGIDEFTSVLDKLVFESIPLAYLEGYHQYSNLAQATFPEACGTICTANAHLSDDLFKFWAAGRMTKGSKLAIAQHGGNYGSGLFSSQEDFELKIADTFFTWGWNGGEKTVPMGSSKLLEAKRKKQRGKGVIYWNLNSCPRYSYRLFSIPFGPTWQEYIDLQIRFAQRLPVHVRKKIVCRPYSSNYGWLEADRIREKVGDVKFDLSGKRWGKALNEASIVLETTNLTTLLESLAADVPTILLMSRDTWEVNDNARPYFDMLQEAGIFFDNYEEAAGKLVSIHADPSEWWSDRKVQNAREAFCTRFAFTSEHWIAQLTSELAKINGYQTN